MTEGKISAKAFENLARASIAQDETIDSLRAELVAVIAERDALRAKVDAVPVGYIEYLIGFVPLGNKDSGYIALKSWLDALSV